MNVSGSSAWFTRIVLSVPLLMGSGTLAQNAERWVVPNADGVAIRCGASSVHNVVTTVGRTSVLRAVLEQDGYIRVAYPSGTYAVVPMDEAELKGGNTVTLTRRSRLKAYSKNDPVMEECWHALMEDFILPGDAAANFRYVGPINNRAGKQEGFVIEAPAGASGWVLAADVRNATPEEMRRAGGGAVPKPSVPAPSGATSPTTTTTPPPPAPAGGQPAVPVSATPGNTTGATGQPVEPAATPNSGGVPSGTTPTGAPAPTGTAPPTMTMPMPEQGNQPAATPTEPIKPKAPPPPSPAELRAKKMKQLDQSFDALNREPIESAEFEPLIAEYEKLRMELGDSGADDRMRSYAGTRVDLLKMRIEHQNTSRAIKELESKAKVSAEDIAERIKKLAKGREYQVVGRMMASVLYDGKRLPLLYRVVSIDTNVSRTVAYLSPAEGQSLDSYLGAIVGVNGEGTSDPGARVRVITPGQIDILQAAGAQ